MFLDPADRSGLSRRQFLGVAGATVAGVTLGGVSWAGAAKSKKLSPLVLSSDLYASPVAQRFALAIARGSEYASGPEVQLALGPPGSTEGTVLETRLYKSGLPKGRGIYVVDAVFDEAGVWNALAVVGRKRVPFVIQVNDAPHAPVVGAAAPRAASPTKVDALGVKPICTRRPRCPLHDQSLSEIIGTGAPVVVMFATPALCQSAYCGPVLDELLDVLDARGNDVAAVHVEIYDSNRGAQRAPTVEAWDLPSEPWVYGIDGSGIITARLDGAFGKQELESLVSELAPTP